MLTPKSLIKLTMNTTATPSLARGDNYRKMYQAFLREGTLHSQANNHVVVKRLVLAGSHNEFAYGIGCFRCGRLSWNPEDVTHRYCPYCRILHDPN